MEIDYESIFKINLRAMKANRSYPAVKRDLKWLIHFTTLHGMYTVVFTIIAYNIVLNLKQNNFSEICRNGTLVIVYCVITMQYFIMVWKQEYFKTLMISMKKDYNFAMFLPVDEQEIMKNYARRGSFICKVWMVMSLVATFLFPLKHMVVTIYIWFIDEFRLTPMYYVIFPQFIEKWMENIAVYIVVYLLFVWYGVYSGLMYVSFVPLGPSFLLHACGQLEIVKKRVDVLFKAGDIEEVRQRLNDVVKQLQYIYDFVDKIKICFTVAYEMTLKGTAILLPITCYEVLESVKRGEISLEFLTFTFGGVLISSVPCFYGDLLMEKGEDVRLAVYSCGWETVFDQGIRSSIRLVLLRALRPIAVHTLFRIVCLDALTDLFQQSYTIFNLMNAMWS